MTAPAREVQSRRFAKHGDGLPTENVPPAPVPLLSASQTGSVMRKEPTPTTPDAGGRRARRGGFLCAGRGVVLEPVWPFGDGG
jgi:hypothetical protein